MTVEEIDFQIRNRIEEEAQKCREALGTLATLISELPTGSLNVRRKIYKKKRYTYYYLVAREGGKISNTHVPDGNVADLQKNLELRDRCRAEVKELKEHLAYLEKLLRVSKGRRSIST